MNVVLKDNTVLSLGLLILMLVVCNLAFARSSGWARWGWQLFGFGGLFFVYRIGGLSLGDIGLSRSRIGIGLKYALVAIAVSFVALVIAYFINQSLFRDTRYNQALGPALLASLFILPLKVVIFEELVFRGVMPALLKDLGSRPWVILVVSSILFGLWHISTTPKSGNITAGHYSNLLIVGAIFMVTSAAGAALYLLRYQSDSLVPAIAVHWFINGAAIVLASLAWS